MSTISNDRLVKAYLKYKGDKTVRDTVYNNLGPLTHFFLLDGAKQVYEKTWKRYDLSHEAQSIREELTKTFHMHDKDFFFAFDEDERTALLDKVDDFQKSLEHDIFIAVIACQEANNDMSLEEQQRFSELWLVNHLAADAQDIHMHQYIRPSRIHPKGVMVHNPYIDTILKLTLDLASIEYPGGDVSEKAYNRLMEAEKILGYKIIKWIKTDAQEEIEQNGTV